MTIEGGEGFNGILNQWAAIGAGGKSGGGPTEDPDTLRSKASAKVLALFCEGQIQGFGNGGPGNNVFLDGTPLISPAGVKMFDDGVEISFRDGSQNQSSLPGFDDVRIEQSLGVPVKKNVGPASATTTSSLLNEIVVRVGVSSLFRVDDEGNIRGDEVRFSVVIRDVFGTFINQGNSQGIIKGKTRGPYDVEYSYPLSGTGPWSVTVTRLTDDSTSARRNNDLFFRAIVGVIYETLRYPNSVLIGVKVSAENFQNVPEVSALLRGTKIKVPTIYNSSSNTYSGVWNGSWKVEYNNNPVWVFFDLLTNKRYGAGLFIEEEDVDIYSLLPIAKYCDEMVPDGKGGMEKRFTFNGYINNRGEAFEVLNSLAATFRGMLYYAGGAITATQDVKANVTRSFSPSNVIVEVDDSGNLTSPPFVYEGTARKARKTVALVSWNDPADRYKSKIEYVEDRLGIERYGYREIDIRGFGCTSQGQAQRLGKWTLLSDLGATETVTFKVGAEGFFMVPGEVIDIADPDKNSGILAGTAPSISESTIVLDRAISLAPNVSYQIIVNDGNGNSVVRAVTTGAGLHDVLTVSPSFPAQLQGPSPWILRESVANPRKYRVAALNEDNGVVTVLATSYNEDKFDIVDSSARIDAQRTSVAPLSIVPIVSAGSIKLETR